MKALSVQVSNEIGLHARPASQLLGVLSGFQSVVKIKKGPAEVNGKSLIGLLSLGVSTGDWISLTIEGPDEVEAFKVLEKFFKDQE